MAYCAVKGCKNNTKFSYQEKNISFHVFPREEQIQNEWLKALGIDTKNWKWSKNRVVCSEHFITNDFIPSYIQNGRTRLKNNVIPSVNLDLTPPKSAIRMVGRRKLKILNNEEPSSISLGEQKNSAFIGIPTLQNGECFFSNDFIQPLTTNIKDENGIEDTVLSNANHFVENIKIESNMEGGQENSYCYIIQKDDGSHDSNLPDTEGNQYERCLFSNNNQPVAVDIKGEMRIDDTIHSHGNDFVENIKVESEIKQEEEDEHNHFITNHHKCEHCSYTTDQIYSLEKHIETVHQNYKSDNTITGCEDIKPQISDVHVEIGNYEYNMCDYMESHSLAVNNKHKYVCNHCDYTTRYASHLKRHMTTVHKTMKIHKCAHCDYTTSYFGLLKQHILTAHEEINRQEHCDDGSSYLSAFINYINTNQR